MSEGTPAIIEELINIGTPSMDVIFANLDSYGCPRGDSGISRQQRQDELTEYFSNLEIFPPDVYAQISSFLVEIPKLRGTVWDCVAKMDGQPDFLYMIRFKNDFFGVLEFPAQNGFGNTEIELQFLHIDEHWFNVYFYIHWVIEKRNCGSSFVKVHLEEEEYINIFHSAQSDKPTKKMTGWAWQLFGDFDPDKSVQDVNEYYKVASSGHTGNGSMEMFLRK